MRTFFDNPPLLKHDNTVGTGYRGKTVSDGKACASSGQLAQRPLHNSLGVRIHVGGGFVEYQDTRVGQYGPRQAYELALPGAETDTPLPHLRIVAFFQSTDEIIGTDCFGYLDNLITAGIQFPVFNIFFDGAGKENRVLRHDANLLP